MATVTNAGDRPTTVTHMAFVHYSNIWKRFRYRAEKAFWVGMPNVHVQLPHELKPGTMWQGMVFQVELLKEVPAGGYLLCEITHTHSRHPVRKRVILNLARERLKQL